MNEWISQQIFIGICALLAVNGDSNGRAISIRAMAADYCSLMNANEGRRKIFKAVVQQLSNEKKEYHKYAQSERAYQSQSRSRIL